MFRNAACAARGSKIKLVHAVKARALAAARHDTVVALLAGSHDVVACLSLFGFCVFQFQIEARPEDALARPPSDVEHRGGVSTASWRERLASWARADTRSWVFKGRARIAQRPTAVCEGRRESAQSSTMAEQGWCDSCDDNHRCDREDNRNGRASRAVEPVANRESDGSDSLTRHTGADFSIPLSPTLSPLLSSPLPRECAKEELEATERRRKLRPHPNYANIPLSEVAGWRYNHPINLDYPGLQCIYRSSVSGAPVFIVPEFLSEDECNLCLAKCSGGLLLR